MVPLALAMLCENCQTISDSRTDTCPLCKSVGCLMSLARVLNPNPEIGAISYIFAANECDA